MKVVQSFAKRSPMFIALRSGCGARALMHERGARLKRVDHEPVVRAKREKDGTDEWTGERWHSRN
jgi:hypothetical protein